MRLAAQAAIQSSTKSVSNKAAPKPCRKPDLKLAASNPVSLVELAPRPAQAVTDEQLVARAQAGDQRAFEMLVMKHQSRIIYLASRFVGDADAPDVAQVAFVKAWKALKSFEGKSQFYTWLYRITVNVAKNHLVSASRRPNNHDIDVSEAETFGHTEHLSDRATPEHLLLADEIKQKVSAAIETLTPLLRQAIILREIEGLSYDEIAVVMDCPVGTVRSRIFRAREELELVIKPLTA
jgi:RNA polymerase sigma-70 factor (ECF subfamily)